MSRNHRNSIDSAESRAALERAIVIAGSQSALAKRIGKAQSTIWTWLHRSKRGVAGEDCEAIERTTGVPRHELRPDLFSDSPRPEEIT